MKYLLGILVLFLSVSCYAETKTFEYKKISDNAADITTITDMRQTERTDITKRLDEKKQILTQIENEIANHNSVIASLNNRIVEIDTQVAEMRKLGITEQQASIEDII